MKMSEETFHDHDDSNDGYCTNCRKITRSGDTEPDACDYPCPDCEKTTCFGVQEALMMGLIEIADDGDSD